MLSLTQVVENARRVYLIPTDVIVIFIIIV